MARYRTIKPELCADEKLTACTVDARFLFLCLLCFVDDMGRKQYSPRRIKSEIFPADTEFTVEVVDELIQQLAGVGVLELYDHGKDHYLRIPHFLDHQVINKPGHSNVPPSPSEDPTKPRCKCKGCQINGNARNARVFLQERPEYYGSRTGVRPDEDSSSTVAGTTGSGIGIGKGDGVSQIQHQHLRNESNSEPAPSQGQTKTSEENRSSPSAASTEYAGSILRLLGLPSNPMIMQDLASTIQIRSEVDGCSIEVSANKLAGRIAVLLRESPPVEWGQWVFDARYDYVPQGDKRLNQRGQMARPTCGGKLCSEGWEPVLIDGDRRLRRCPDCVRAWKDAGLE
jgi:hypothetical protein